MRLDMGTLGESQYGYKQRIEREEIMRDMFRIA
jgi:hypothetical protein